MKQYSHINFTWGNFFSWQLSAIIQTLGERYKVEVEIDLLKMSARKGLVSTTGALYKLCPEVQIHPFIVMLRNVVSAWQFATCYHWYMHIYSCRANYFIQLI